MYRYFRWLTVLVTIACGGCQDARSLMDHAPIQRSAAGHDYMAGHDYILSWIAPIEQEDGSPLTNLAGFRIYSNNDLVLDIRESGTFSAAVNGKPGDLVWITAYNSDGVESDPSSSVMLP